LREKLSARRAPRRGGISRGCVFAGRILFLFIAILLTVMPVTERLWTFDGLLPGGQDFEFGLLSVATILCLTFVLTQQSKQGSTFLLITWRWLSRIFHPVQGPKPSLFHGKLALHYLTPVSSCALDLCTLPLRI